MTKIKTDMVVRRCRKPINKIKNYQIYGGSKNG